MISWEVTHVIGSLYGKKNVGRKTEVPGIFPANFFTLKLLLKNKFAGNSQLPLAI